MPIRLAAVVISAAALVGCASTDSAKPAASAAAAPAASEPQAPKAAARSAAQIGMTEILDDPKKMAVFQKHAPALASNEQISMARGMTLADVAGYAEAGLSEPMVKAIVDDINKL
jgi:hypothetical protein